VGYMFTSGEQASPCASIDKLIQDEAKSNPLLVPYTQHFYNLVVWQDCENARAGACKKKEGKLEPVNEWKNDL
jgi:hypothetical protein